MFSSTTRSTTRSPSSIAQRNGHVRTAIAVTAYVVALQRLEHVMELLGVWPELVLYELEPKRLASTLQEIRQLLDFQ